MLHITPHSPPGIAGNEGLGAPQHSSGCLKAFHPPFPPKPFTTPLWEPPKSPQLHHLGGWGVPLNPSPPHTPTTHKGRNTTIS